EMDRLYVPKGAEAQSQFDALIRQIKEAGRGRQYDCLVGVSGGVDSTYVAYIAKREGLRALAVHLDNGWNSELAVKNIENIVTRLGFDLFTYVIDWNEFRDLQLSYLKASVVDIEAATDHAISGILYRLALKHRVKFILGGNNVQTETVLPRHWYWNKDDYINVKAIHAKFGTVPLKTYPFFGFREKWLSEYKNIRTVPILNYLPYIKSEVKKTIQEELGWRDYGGKHYESIWTRFYQGYILPAKFGIDKRRGHLSSLIGAGQITRDEALAELKKPIYDEEQMKTDRTFVLKKFGLTEDQFINLIALPIRSHRDFASHGPIYDRYPMLRPLKPLGDFVKKTFLTPSTHKAA
ncbi:MAG: N-acetyl sugar amidotransferase, partial [Verrucomicrobiales bacterium]|nr:N-acetyl sugar amidotransferase [Verrucomicrobiales bacterium]